MRQFNFVSIKSVLSSLEDTMASVHWDEGSILENAYTAVAKIGIYQQYEEDVYFTLVEDHKACLPVGIVQINQIAYKKDLTLPKDEIEEYERILGIDNEEYMQNSSLAVQAFLNSKKYGDNWGIMRLATNKFANAVHCKDCVNFYATCNEEYSVHPDGTITTSFKEGYLCIAYLRMPVDEDGYIMIPDNEEYKDAIRIYLLARIWESRMNAKEEGAMGMHQYYLRRWSTAKAKAMADVRMPDLAEMENLKNVAVRLLPKFNRFAGGFGNLNSQENLSLQGFSVGSRYRTR